MENMQDSGSRGPGLKNTVVDTDGRYVIVSSTLQNIPVVLVSVYAPTWDDDQFFLRLFAKIPNADSHRIIIGGDFNLVQDVTLDRSAPTQATLLKSANIVKTYASLLGISDSTVELSPFFPMYITHSPELISFYLIIIS